MLTPAELELLTAAVDGELDARQQRQFARLLNASPEARATFRQLQQDAAAVRALPQRACPVDLTANVLANLPKRTPHPRRPVTTPAPTPNPVGVPAWFGLALAASVLCVISLASYVYFAISQPPQQPSNPTPPNFVENNPPRPQPVPNPVPPTIPGEYKPGPSDLFPEWPALAKEGQRPELSPESPISPEVPNGPIFTGPSGERFELKTIEPTVPTTHKVQGLDRARLQSELAKANAFRLELPARDAGKAVERLLYVFKSQHRAPTIDPIAAGRLARAAQWKSSYVVVLEDITPTELANLLDALAEADRKGEPKKGTEPTTAPVLPTKFVLSRLNRNDQRDLADHLGAELPSLSSRATGPLGVDPTRPLPEQTQEEIERRLNAGNLVRPALLLAYGVPKVVTPSAEVKKYLDARKSARPGTLQVMLVLRHVG